MSGKLSSIVSSSEKLDISKMSFEERLQYGAENAVRCMGVTSHDRVFIITDYDLSSSWLLEYDHHVRLSGSYPYSINSATGLNPSIPNSTITP